MVPVQIICRNLGSFYIDMPENHVVPDLSKSVSLSLFVWKCVNSYAILSNQNFGCFNYELYL